MGKHLIRLHPRSGKDQTHFFNLIQEPRNKNKNADTGNELNAGCRFLVFVSSGSSYWNIKFVHVHVWFDTPSRKKNVTGCDIT